MGQFKYLGGARAGVGAGEKRGRANDLRKDSGFRVYGFRGGFRWGGYGSGFKVLGSFQLDSGT